MQVAVFAVLPSVSSKEKIFIVLQRKRVSTCADIMDGSYVASLFKNVKSNMPRPQGHMLGLRKMHGNFDTSEYLKT